MARKLHAVPADEKAAKPVKAKSVTEAASKGTKREFLIAMRDRIAAAVEDPNTPPRDLGTLTKRLSDVWGELEVLDAQDEEESVDNGGVEDEAFDASAI